MQLQVKSKGVITPFFTKIRKNKKLFFISLLGANIILASLVDFFELESYFTAPGNEEDFKSNIVLFIIFIGFVVPVFEEFIFRFWIFENISKILAPLILLILYLLYLDYNWFLKISFILIFAFHIICIFYFKMNLLMISILNGVVFGIFHFVNYPIQELIEGLVYLPILFFPQFILGAFVCLIREFGFRYCIIYHASYNLILIIFEYVRISI
jgi:membrane protease YdiL (CAAX protease family)